MSKTGVLQICLTLDTGGLERVVVNLANEVARTGSMETQICTVGHTTGEVIPATIAPNVRWTELKGKPHFTVKTALKLAGLARANNVGLLHAHGTQPLVYALTTSMLCGLPIVFTKHNSYEDLDFFARHKFFKSAACRRVRRFIGVSEQATEILRRVFKPAEHRCQTLINGTELPAESVRQTAMFARNAYSKKDKSIIVTVCRLAPEKDLVTLLWAFSTVHKVEPTTELWIVGDGSERNNLVKLTEHLGIKQSVRFWGFRGKVDQILSCADVFVNSSWTEGISISILEAMALGLPIVATAVGGTPSIVKDGDNGLLVEPRNPQDLSRALLRVVRDRELCRKFGDSSWRQVEQHWSLRRMAERYIMIYGESVTKPIHLPAEAAAL